MHSTNKYSLGLQLFNMTKERFLLYLRDQYEQVYILYIGIEGVANKLKYYPAISNVTDRITRAGSLVHNRLYKRHNSGKTEKDNNSSNYENVKYSIRRLYTINKYAQ